MKQLNARQLEKELNIRGWTFARMRDGSHMQFKKVGVPNLITIPVHGARPIRPGLLRRILRDAGIDPSEL
jgi:predicted RNA binding protein YcfA (HicA-like mRNA interferase family)